MAEQLIKLFSKELQENLFPSNEFYKQSKLDGGVDVNAKTIEIPQAGSTPTVTKNASSFPLTAATRTDDVKTYSVDLYSTEPIHIQDVNEMVINYSKRSDVIKDHSRTLNTRIADEIAYEWTPTAGSNIIVTTGAADNSALAPGATGTRKVITYEDIVKLATMFDIDDVDMGARNLLIDTRLYAQLLKVDQFVNFDFFNRKPAVDGQIGEILGMKVFKRSKSTYFDVSNVKKAVGAAGAATDNLGILAWADNAVRRAEGNVKLYADIENPLYLGSIFNASVRAGGTIGRTDSKGVYALVQTA